MSKMLRKVLERLSRGRSYKRRLPREFGSVELYVSPDAALRYLRVGAAAFDSRLLAVAREFAGPGMVVWDIGANVGSFSLAAAHLAGPTGMVLAVEPDVWLADMVRRSALLPGNRHLALQVLAAAVADKAGVGGFHIAERGRASNALESGGGRSQAGGVRERQLVPLVRLDDLLDVSPPPDLVKIDVEGAEFAALAGGTRLLHSIRPLIYCEVGRENDAAVTALLLQAGYILLDPSANPGERRPLASCPFNVLACPREKAGSLTAPAKQDSSALSARASSSVT